MIPVTVTVPPDCPGGRMWRPALESGFPVDALSTPPSCNRDQPWSVRWNDSGSMQERETRDAAVAPLAWMLNGLRVRV